jgi:hypothetical protein
MKIQITLAINLEIDARSILHRPDQHCAALYRSVNGQSVFSI